MQLKINHLFIFFAGMVISFSSVATDDPGCDAKIKLQDYGPNTVSVRKDDYDAPNIDFTLSQMIPVFQGIGRSKSGLFGRIFLLRGASVFMRLKDGIQDLLLESNSIQSFL